MHSVLSGSFFRAFYLSLTAFFFAFLLAMFMAAPFASAQMLPSTAGQSDSINQFQPMIDKAKEEGLSVIVISPGADANKAANEQVSESFNSKMLSFRAKVRRLLLNAPNAWDEMVKTLKAASPDGTWNWLWIAIATALGALLVSNIIAYYFRKYVRPMSKNIFVEDPQTRSQKIGFLLFRASIISINCIIMLAVALLVALIFDQGHEPSRATIETIVVTYVLYWVFRAVIFFNIIAHDLPKHRMINLDDENAKKMQVHWRRSVIVILLSFAVCDWMSALGINDQIHKFFLVVASIIATTIFVTLTVVHAKALRGIALGMGNPDHKPHWRRTFATALPTLLVIYLVVAWGISVQRIILERPGAGGIVLAPAIAFVVGLAVYGIFLLILDRLYAIRRKRFEMRVNQERARLIKQKEAEEKARAEAAAKASDEDENDQLVINQLMHKEDINLENMPVFKPIFKSLLEKAAGVWIVIAAIAFITSMWNFKIGEEGNPVGSFFDIIFMIFIGWFAYRSVVLFINARLEDEVGPEEEEGPGEGEGGQGATRVQTLLPLLRNVLIATIFVIVGMLILSNMGVDIAPLFAGAGVIGLAVGFGAQTLIRDIFSGGFFLFDDAFRKGEYIELDNIRGTVEKISLRSFQLRHHNGPLHTVPFGEIKQLTNYSRDWVIMKLPLRVTYDTDVDRVRKLVKKLGQKLLEHPDVGHTFLQPLKSQGVYKMEDSAMIIRVKFMTRPGEQWVTRKVVYSAIRDLFEDEGIRFAHKEVTVRLAEENADLPPEKKRKVLEAAASAVADNDLDEGGMADDGADAQ